jgi:hypothetical protein
MTEDSTSSKSFGFLNTKQTIQWAAAIYVAALLVFSGTMAARLLKPSPDNHYVYLADAMLHGRLSIEGKPPHRNDWAEYQGKWYVSFPPAPAVLMIPGVAAFGLHFNDRLFTLGFAAAGPALLFLIIAALVRRKSIDRKPWEAALLSGLYGVGTVYYFGAVQGSVWYSAHMVGSFFLLLFILASLNCRHPILAGFCLILAFACRPPMLLAFPFFIFEAHTFRLDPSLNFVSGLKAWDKKIVLSNVRSMLLFAAPIAVIMCLLMWMNAARFDNPFEFGHGLLKVRWTGRIEKWGLFNYHYLARNLAVFGALLPWVSPTKPYIQISNHGLALWFTTPVLFYILWPKVKGRLYTALAITAAAVAVPSLFYQNSGWVQFGYRFALDYMPFLMLLIAASGRRFSKLFYALVVFSVAVNLFGAVTFDRIKSVFPSKAPTAYFEPD